MDLLDVYVLLAVAYNLVSQLSKDLGFKAFAPTDPMIGTMLMIVVYLWFNSVESFTRMPSIALCAVLIYFIARFGIYRHATSYREESYHSRLTWCGAILINLFGVSILAHSIVVGS